MEIFITLLIILICLILEGFFSGSEMAIVSADQIKLRHQAAKGSKGAKLALKMLEKPEWLLSTTLVGTNISVVTNTTIATALMIQLFGDNGSWLAIIFIAPLIWIFGEIVPKSIFQQRADDITPYAIFILRFFSIVFYPILLIFSFLTKLLSKLSGVDHQNVFTLREEIVSIVHMPATPDGDISPVEQTMIKRMFNFSETKVSDVMTPLIDVVAVEKGISCSEAREVSVQKAHVMLPVYNQRVDEITGVIYTLDIIAAAPDKPITDYIQPAFYTPGSKSIRVLMSELRKEGSVMGIVVDEFGGAEGIITMEDIMEEVVDDMEDEYDTHEQTPTDYINTLSQNEYIINARIELDLLCEKLKIDIPKGDYTTLAGYIIDKVQGIPKKGTNIEVNGISLKIQKSSEKTIERVKISLKST